MKREQELQYLRDKREKLYLQPDSLKNKVKIDILTEKIDEILNERTKR